MEEGSEENQKKNMEQWGTGLRVKKGYDRRLDGGEDPVCGPRMSVNLQKNPVK